MNGSKADKHLCWDCRKAEDRSCDVYNQLESLIEANFDLITIQFQVPECEFFEEEEMLSKPGKIARRSTTLSR
ncbi:MAG: hypothetical protein ACFFB3_18400 [Candidatus Hodarchaeota archaeon]